MATIFSSGTLLDDVSFASTAPIVSDVLKVDEIDIMNQRIQRFGQRIARGVVVFTACDQAGDVLIEWRDLKMRFYPIATGSVKANDVLIQHFPYFVPALRVTFTPKTAAAGTVYCEGFRF